MATNPPLFDAVRRRPEEALGEVVARRDELTVHASADDAAGDVPSGRDRIRAWLADDARFFSLVAVVIVATVVGLASLVSATRPEVPEPEVVAAAVETPEPEPEPEPVPDEPELAPPPLPLTMRIDTIGVDAPLVSVGLDGTAMEIPDDVREIGWYDPDDLGVRPGTTGTAVFASHVDSRTQGRGVLFELRRMRVGETIEIDLEDGTTQTWVVTEVAQIPKVAMPLNDIFTWAGPPRTVIITCGGEFDRRAGSYVDNIVVYAEPLDQASAQAEDAPSA